MNSDNPVESLSEGIEKAAKETPAAPETGKPAAPARRSPNPNTSIPARRTRTQQPPELHER